MYQVYDLNGIYETKFFKVHDNACGYFYECLKDYIMDTEKESADYGFKDWDAFYEHYCYKKAFPEGGLYIEEIVFSD